MSEFHLAQYNIGRIRRPLDHSDVTEFVAALGPINTLAELSPGFVWRLTDEEGQSSSYVEVDGIDDPLIIVNYSIWNDLDSLKHFIHKSGHIAYLRRRLEWFEHSEEATSVAWWVPSGPTTHGVVDCTFPAAAAPTNQLSVRRLLVDG